MREKKDKKYKKYIKFLKKDLAKSVGMSRRELFGRKANKLYEKTGYGVSLKYLKEREQNIVSACQERINKDFQELYTDLDDYLEKKSEENE